MALIYEKKGRIAYITLNRPEAQNAFDPETVVDIISAWKDYQDDDDLRCAIITGSGDEVFSSGADLKKLIPLITGIRQPETDADKMIQKDPYLPQKAFLRTMKIDKPIIAAINGPCAGISLVLTLFCDMRIAAADAKFTSAFVKRGLITEYGGSWLLPRIAGFGNAMDVWLTGRVFNGTEAKELGVVNRVLPQEDFLENAMAIAHDMANNNSPRSMRIIKQQLWESLFQDLDTALDMAHTEMKASIASEDFKEGVSHFLQKRAPNFSGK